MEGVDEAVAAEFARDHPDLAFPPVVILIAAYDEADARFADTPVPCPSYWGGFAVRPVEVEFWQGRSGRMHDRIAYRRNPDETWKTVRLAP